VRRPTSRLIVITTKSPSRIKVFILLYMMMFRIVSVSSSSSSTTSSCSGFVLRHVQPGQFRSIENLQVLKAFRTGTAPTKQIKASSQSRESHSSTRMRQNSTRMRTCPSRSGRVQNVNIVESFRAIPCNFVKEKENKVNSMRYTRYVQLPHTTSLHFTHKKGTHHPPKINSSPVSSRMELEWFARAWGLGPVVSTQRQVSVLVHKA
jgi:hypothetical protein